MIFENTITVLTVLGIGGILGAYIKHLLVARQETSRKIAERKEEQYKTFLENLLGFFVGWENKDKQKKFMEELYTHAPMYASDEVIRLANAYLESKQGGHSGNSDECYKKLVLAIRSDLKGVLNRKSRLKESDIHVMKLDE